MSTHLVRALCAMLLTASSAFAQAIDPFPQPIAATEGVIRVGLTEFATVPDGKGEAARLMTMLTETGTRRLFASDMAGALYSISYDGKSVTKYLDLTASNWNVAVQADGRERGLQSFAFHPQFAQQGSRGYGKFYTYVDTTNTQPPADFNPGGDPTTHHTVLLEWTSRNAAASTYDGGPPRELFRLRQPFPNHNGGMIGFNPLAMAGTPEFGLLYVGVADGGSGGDPFRHGQNLGSGFGKIFRIDPLGNNSANKKYGIPASNPFVNDNNPMTLGEIYAYGVRNPQRFGWDPKNGNMFLAEIGQNIVEEVSQVTAGANLGWNEWEASFKFISRTELDLTRRRTDPKVTYPIVEYDHRDPLFPSGRASVTGIVVYRGTAIPQLTNTVLFGDMPSGEMFYVSADRLPAGGQDAIRRVLFNSGGSSKTLLQIIKEKKPSADRADIRFGNGPNNRIFLLNKADGIIREIVR